MIFSYSLLDTFHNVCRRQAYHKFVLRDVKTTYTQADGIDAHKALEERLKADKPLPATLAKAEPFCRSLKRPGTKLALEVKLGLGQDGKPCDFFSQEARYRSVPDVLAYKPESASGVIFDWKTGKKRDNGLQHDINALLVFAHYPRLDTLRAANLYTRTGELGDVLTYTREGRAPVAARIERLSAEIEREETWTPRRGPLCGWCPVTTCEHYVPR